eukprot:7824821-Alexandrium_andersonii.AAC.1
MLEYSSQFAEAVVVPEEALQGAWRIAVALRQLPAAMQTCPVGRAVEQSAPAGPSDAAPARWVSGPDGGRLARSGSPQAVAAAAADRRAAAADRSSTAPEA